jgi:hypothetical protein
MCHEKYNCLGNIAEFISAGLPDNSNIRARRRENFLKYFANNDGTAGKKIYNFIKADVLK